MSDCQLVVSQRLVFAAEVLELCGSCKQILSVNEETEIFDELKVRRDDETIFDREARNWKLDPFPVFLLKKERRRR